jgi:hypothetical protein
MAKRVRCTGEGQTEITNAAEFSRVLDGNSRDQGITHLIRAQSESAKVGESGARAAVAKGTA